MKYVTAIKFLEAEKSVTSGIIDWYKKNVQVGDLVTEPRDRISPYLLKDMSYVNDFLRGYMGNSVPLLSCEQLVSYIRYITKNGLSIECYGEIFKVCPYFEPLENKKEPRWYKENIEFRDVVLVDALWKCLIEVATDVYYIR